MNHHPFEKDTTSTRTVATRKLQRSVTFHDELVFDDDDNSHRNGEDGNSLDNDYTTSTSTNNNNNNKTKKKHRRLILHRLIDQGPNRSVYLASDVTEERRPEKTKHPRTTTTLYAVKQIECLDDRRLEECRREIAVHRTVIHENVLPLLDVKMVNVSTARRNRNPNGPTEEDEPTYDKREETTATTGTANTNTNNITPPCHVYLQFPYLPHSLGDDLLSRKLLRDTLESQRRPYTTVEALSLFRGILCGVQALHHAGFSHRDIKADNVLLCKDPSSLPSVSRRQTPTKKSRVHVGIPLLADMGSAAATAVRVASAAEFRTVMREDIERNTTLAYRAPELFSERRKKNKHKHNHNHNHNHKDEEHEDEDTSFVLRYDRADVWSLGCLLFSILYGASPLEVRWGVSFVEGMEAEGSLRFVGRDASAILERIQSLEEEEEAIPFPPLGSAADRRYGEGLKDLVRSMLVVDWRKRPSVEELLRNVETLRHSLCDGNNDEQAG